MAWPPGEADVDDGYALAPGGGERLRGVLECMLPFDFCRPSLRSELALGVDHVVLEVHDEERRPRRVNADHRISLRLVRSAVPHVGHATERAFPKHSWERSPPKN